MKIDKPCLENFSAMQKADGGSYCKVCEKIVVDFTSYSNEELKNYFVVHKQESTCGIFKAHQVKTNNVFTNQMYHLDKWIHSISFNPLKLTLLTLFSSLVTLTGCFMGKATPINKSNNWDDTQTSSDTLKVGTKQNEIKK